jgi:hypothetical protein
LTALQEKQKVNRAKSSDQLKITGKPELHKNEKLERV